MTRSVYGQWLVGVHRKIRSLSSVFSGPQMHRGSKADRAHLSSICLSRSAVGAPQKTDPSNLLFRVRSGTAPNIQIRPICFSGSVTGSRPESRFVASVFSEPAFGRLGSRGRRSRWQTDASKLSVDSFGLASALESARSLFPRRGL